MPLPNACQRNTDIINKKAHITYDVLSSFDASSLVFEMIHRLVIVRVQLESKKSNENISWFNCGFICA